MIFAVEDDDSIREIEIYTLTSVGFASATVPRCSRRSRRPDPT